MKNRFKIVVLLLQLPLVMYAVQPLSLEESLTLLQEHNIEKKVAAHEVRIAEKEHQKSLSYWYPFIGVQGEYAFFSNAIEFRQSLKPLQLDIEQYLADYGLNTDETVALLSRIGDRTLVFDLAPQNVFTLDATLSWPIFTGMRRIYGAKITRDLVNIAKTGETQVDAAIQTTLVYQYFALRLSKHIVQVRSQTVQDLEKHYHNAEDLEQNGMLNKADRLLVQVTLDEARCDYESAVKDMEVARRALLTTLNLEDMQIEPTTALFLNEALPSRSYFEQQYKANSPILKQIELQENIALNTKRMSVSGYFPQIALLGKQTMLQHGVNKYLVPRSMVGVGLTWNLFDGLQRESDVAQSKITKEQLELARDKAASDLNVSIDKYYTQLENCMDRISALEETLSFSQELLRMRRESFAEGMATATDVVDAQLLYSRIKVSILMAYFEYDVALMNLCAISGVPQEYYQFQKTGRVYS